MTIGLIASELASAALALDDNQADPSALTTALNENLELWVMIKTLVSASDTVIADDLKSNLLKLSDYVATTTFKFGASNSADDLKSLININYQIANGIQSIAA